MQHVLFICTGNYYRSRFAELLFNDLAARRGVAWRAFSRGTDVHGAGRFNLGAISPWARAALEARGVVLDPRLRGPAQLTDDDLALAHLLVAVSEREHRPHLERGHPDAVQRITFWAVEDLHLVTADHALAELERRVLGLLDDLAAAAAGPTGGSAGVGRAGAGEAGAAARPAGDRLAAD